MKASAHRGAQHTTAKVSGADRTRAERVASRQIASHGAQSVRRSCPCGGGCPRCAPEAAQPDAVRFSHSEDAAEREARAIAARVPNKPVPPATITESSRDTAQ